MPHAKANLPEKRCAVCGRPFAWRRKWARVWDQVKYCGERCRRGAKKAPPVPPTGDKRQA